MVTREGHTDRIELPRDGEVIIGRAQSCDVILDDKLLSRQHAIIRVADALSIEDLDSQNGTVLVLPSGEVGTQTGRSVERRLEPGQPQRLPDDAMVKLGSALITVRVYGQTSEPTQYGSDYVVVDESMVRLFELAERVAASDLSVLLLGESGAGKDVVARFIHSRSPRAGNRLVSLNCGALPESLLESELFGHEKGAFTGAAKTTPGLLETASASTLFLDEIGELSAPLQVKLLRVLEANQVNRLGGREPIDIDVRFLAATNRDLESEVANGSFREDLYYRVNGITLTIPPLRDRSSDIVPLARSFVAQLAQQQGRASLTLSEEAEARLREHSWPGNVRELKNVIHRTIVLCRDDVVSADDLQVTARAAKPAAEKPSSRGGLRELQDEARQLERQRIVEALDACAGNQTRAAEMLGITRRALIVRLKKYDIPRPRSGKT